MSLCTDATCRLAVLHAHAVDPYDRRRSPIDYTATSRLPVRRPVLTYLSIVNAQRSLLRENQVTPDEMRKEFPIGWLAEELERSWGVVTPAAKRCIWELYEVGKGGAAQIILKHGEISNRIQRWLDERLAVMNHLTCKICGWCPICEVLPNRNDGEEQKSCLGGEHTYEPRAATD
jgi:hypothetical protein